MFNKSTWDAPCRSKRATRLRRAIPCREVILMPYVNGRRWGSHEFPDSNGRALLLLPLPIVGTAEIEVVAVPRDTSLWCGLKDYRPYLTGRPMPNAGLHSNKIDVDVRRRDIPQRPEHPTAFVSQWEPWFAPGSMWTTAQAVPLVGFYDFTDPDVIRQHLLWLMDSGADAVLFDWSNHIWGLQKHWDERGDGVERHRAQHRTGARSDGRHARRGSSRSAGDHHAGPERTAPRRRWKR